MTKFNKGDTVVVTTSAGAFEGTLPVGSTAKVRAVSGTNMCQSYEVLLEGSTIYHFEDNLALSEANVDPLTALQAAVDAAREAGYNVQCQVSQSITYF